MVNNGYLGRGEDEGSEVARKSGVAQDPEHQRPRR